MITSRKRARKITIITGIMNIQACSTTPFDASLAST
jgi:hypothetical protein